MLLCTWAFDGPSPELVFLSFGPRTSSQSRCARLHNERSESVVAGKFRGTTVHPSEWDGGKPDAPKLRIMGLGSLVERLGRLNAAA